MSDLRRPPTLRHVFRLTDGETLICPHRDARRTVDRRDGRGPVVVVWEVTLASGIVRRLWPEDIRTWSLEMR